MYICRFEGAPLPDGNAVVMLVLSSIGDRWTVQNVGKVFHLFDTKNPIAALSRQLPELLEVSRLISSKTPSQSACCAARTTYPHLSEVDDFDHELHVPIALGRN